MNTLTMIRNHLIALYGAQKGQHVSEQLMIRLKKHPAVTDSPQPNLRTELNHADAILITYADQVSQAGEPPLQTLTEFCQDWLRGVISSVHLLPFYPSSSDDGFSVIDYRAVDPRLGDWTHIAQLGRHFRLMFDAVINHISAHSTWFQAFLNDDPGYLKHFITIEGNPDLSQVARPRALPLLTQFNTRAGVKSVWTTFSSDQIDLNYANPDILLEMVDLLLEYVQKGATMIRLDAVAFLWKEIGTRCLHHPNTHRIIQVFRCVLDLVAPQVLLITETNVPHHENISYFGNGANEAQLVYNFALPPLVLNTLLNGNADQLTAWARQLEMPLPGATFFNFLASHDGIGLNPVAGILSSGEINALVEHTRYSKGLISLKDNPDGSQSPYELNINYFDALARPDRSEPVEQHILRFLSAHAVMLSMPGVPGIYFHSLFGSRGWPNGIIRTGRNRSINRQKLERRKLEMELGQPNSARRRIFDGFVQLLRARAGNPAFHPAGTHTVLPADKTVFAILRRSPDQRQRVLCLHNITDKPVEFDLAEICPPDLDEPLLKDILTGDQPALHNSRLTLSPYQIFWGAVLEEHDNKLDP